MKYMLLYFVLFIAELHMRYIYQEFMITTHYYIVFCHLMIDDFS